MLTDIGYRDRFIGVNPLRDARRQKGMTQVQLAEAVSCGQGFLSDIERGEANPSLALARRIAEALDCPLDELFGTTVEVGE